MVTAPTDDAIRNAFKTNEPLTSLEDITNYNNFYEFSTVKEEVASAARGFVTRPWTVDVSGLVKKPKTFDLDDLLKLAPQEERIYRLRCVEGWSMVIPWIGFPLNALLKQVEPQTPAKYVAFQTLLDPKHANQTQACSIGRTLGGAWMSHASLTILATDFMARRCRPRMAPRFAVCLENTGLRASVGCEVTWS